MRRFRRCLSSLFPKEREISGVREREGSRGARRIFCSHFRQPRGIVINGKSPHLVKGHRS